MSAPPPFFSPVPIDFYGKVVLIKYTNYAYLESPFSFWLSSASWATFKQRGQHLLSAQHLYKDQQCELDHVTCNSIGYLLARGIHCTKFSDFPVKGSRDLTSNMVKRY